MQNERANAAHLLSTPEPVVCRYSDGELMGTLHYRDGEWQMDYAPGFKPGPGSGPPRDEIMGYVYFIGPADGAIKIGFAQSVESRLATLRRMSPVPLQVFATCRGTYSMEHDYHRRFASSRLHGEWFERTPELLAEIERLTPSSGICLEDEGEMG